jgi:6-pyruvoyltetrahydropterin/6-carboxytetrahydropterin synthase
MKFRTRVEGYFDASHFIKGHPGKCSQVHGHTYKVEAFFVTDQIDAMGISIDFGKLKSELNNILNSYDHRFLGNASAESIATDIYLLLKKSAKLPVEKLRVWEGVDKYVEVYE